MNEALDPMLQERIAEWIKAPGHRREKTLALKHEWDTYVTESLYPSDEALESLDTMRHRLGLPSRHYGRKDSDVPPAFRRTTKHRGMNIWQAVALFIPFLLITGSAWLTLRREAWIEPAPAEIIITSTGGDHKHIILPDSSEVWLRSGSRMSYPEQFTENREVRLSGEAYFSINKKEYGTFTVTSDYLEAEVQGTSFNLCAFPGEGRASLKLYSGSIQVLAAGQKVRLSPGELLTYNANSFEVDVTYDPASDPAVWRTGILQFKSVTLDEILQICERNFGVRIVADGPLSSLRHSVTFGKNDDLEDILNVLQLLTQEFDYTIENHIVKIARK